MSSISFVHRGVLMTGEGKKVGNGLMNILFVFYKLRRGVLGVYASFFLLFFFFFFLSRFPFVVLLLFRSSLFFFLLFFLGVVLDGCCTVQFKNIAFHSILTP